jgi:phosphonate transport system ATP-binding protein
MTIKPSAISDAPGMEAPEAQAGNDEGRTQPFAEPGASEAGCGVRHPVRAPVASGSAPGNACAVEINHLKKTYGKTQALKNVSLSIMEGEMVALIGASGSGKSTLLKHLSGLEVSDTTDCFIKVCGKTIQRNGDLTTNIRKLRADIGFIFQQFNLVGRMSLLKNVVTGMLAGIPLWRSITQCFTQAEKIAAMEALRRVGMAEYAGQRASTLSGGQQQRAAIARALVQEPKIILADEPIASLDPESSRKVMRSLRKINSDDHVTVVVSLHQVDFAMQFCDRIVGLRDGEILCDGSPGDIGTETLRELYGAEFSDVEEGMDILALISENKPQKPANKNGDPARRLGDELLKKAEAEL